MTYDPKPVDCSGIDLSPELQELEEWLAAQNHDVWAKRRLAEGWTYGPVRDDARKQHPGLVPYDQLSESEKEYDRRAALHTLEFLLSSGWNLTPPGKRIDPDTVASVVESLRRMLQSEPRPSLASLLSVWRSGDEAVWSLSPEPYRLLAQALLGEKEHLVAFDVARAGLTHFRSDLRLRQLMGLALARSGATESAQAWLQQIYDEGHRDEETVGILARTYKDLGEQASDSAMRVEHLRKAHGYYLEAYHSTGGYWSGINAATLAVALNDRDSARTLARSVRDQCLSVLLKAAGHERYWAQATLGEAALILGEWEEAESRYRQAMEERPGYGDVDSSRRNARLLMSHLDGDRERIESCFHIPAVVVFAGHMIDRPDRRAMRFPPSERVERAVKQAILERLRRIDAGFGYTSAACGSDILFIENMLELGREVRVVLPYDTDEFREDSVDIIPGASWGRRYEAALAKVAEVSSASFQRMTAGTTLYEYANLVVQGLAMFRARQLDTKLIPLVVWDGKPGDGPGGTASVVERWRSKGIDVEVIDLTGIVRDELGATPEIASEAVAPSERRQTGKLADPEIRGLLFADAVGFSKLTEGEVPLFAEHFLGLVGDLVKRPEYAPLTKNTWGDGLYIVFEDVRQAGLFSLELCERVRRTDWKQKGLRDLDLRIGLHAGPVHCITDPVTERESYIGAHVSRAARIEPVTPPGHAYASQEFAAIAATEGISDFSCEYVGRLPQAKGYGTFATYVVRRNGGPVAP